jgi:hypothetical protein
MHLGVLHTCPLQTEYGETTDNLQPLDTSIELAYAEHFLHPAQRRVAVFLTRTMEDPSVPMEERFQAAGFLNALAEGETPDE